MRGEKRPRQSEKHDAEGLLNPGKMTTARSDDASQRFFQQPLKPRPFHTLFLKQALESLQVLDDGPAVIVGQRRADDSVACGWVAELVSGVGVSDVAGAELESAFVRPNPRSAALDLLFFGDVLLGVAFGQHRFELRSQFLLGFVRGVLAQYLFGEAIKAKRDFVGIGNGVSELGLKGRELQGGVSADPSACPRPFGG